MNTDLSARIPQDIKDFIIDIQEQVKGQFAVYLAGGFLRDLDNGLTPKDVDIFFTPCNDTKQDLGYIPARCYVNYNKKVSSFTHTDDMEQRGVSQVVGLFNSKLSTTEIQFIVYDKCLTMEAIAEDLDMGINQIIWSPILDRVIPTEGYLNDHSNKTITCLHDYAEVRTFRRFERMLEKFQDYTPINMPSKEVLPLSERIQRMTGSYVRPTSVGSFVGEEE